MRTVDLGDGDVCPIVPAHGKMLTIKGSNPPRQRCGHQSHDPRPKTHPLGKAPGTPSIWPLNTFGAAVAEYHRQTEVVAPVALPDLDALEF